MIYRTLGRTGLKVSQLGFGCMRLPMVGEGDDAHVDTDATIAMLHRAFEAGVTYVDTAVFYCKADSQRAVGEALRGWRDKVVLSTKNHYYEDDESAWWGNLEDSLRLLQTDVIDIYNCHGVSWDRYTNAIEPRVYGWLEKARDQGLIRHICCSFHDNNDALMKVVDTGRFESITLQYNMADTQLAEGIAHARASGMGVVVMGPVGGGMLAEDSEVLGQFVPGISSTAELAIRFVLSNPNVSVALSGMTKMADVESNLTASADEVSLSEEDCRRIDERMAELKTMAELYCTGCKYCLPCPSGVAIPQVFHDYNRGRVYGLWDAARGAYGRIGAYDGGESKKADACSDCGECEDKCPQNIPIRKQLAEAHSVLAGCDAGE
ncbi:MAG: aldo/keto reductase [Planctomycetota bacterium]|jgi:predicted aldo/keto reductase-like oxidoreductase